MFQSSVPCVLFLLLTCLPCSISSSEFDLTGDYLLGGLFPIHEVHEHEAPRFFPEPFQCFRYPFSKSGYQMMQVMRFAVEEINNSTALLPNVSLGYEIFDHCSDTKNFHSVLSFISRNGTIKPKETPSSLQPKVMALVGPYGSTRTMTVAPLFSLDLIPLVNYGATGYALSDTIQYPSFLRTIPSNKDLIEMIIRIIRWFGWNWVAFLGGQDDYSKDGLRLFQKFTSNTDICLAYQEILNYASDCSQTFELIDLLKVNVIVVFAGAQYASKIIKAAIANDIRDKVWIASETWSMNQQLPREPGIERIGTVLGITENFSSLPGFDEFLYKEMGRAEANQSSQGETCNQECDCCSLLSADEIINENPTYSFGIYAAIYSVAHGLNKVLQCDVNGCHKNATIQPYMVLEEMKKLDFPLNGRQVKYDQNGDASVSFAVILWITETSPPQFERVGQYETYPHITFTINNSLLPWHSAGVPFSNCSVECRAGLAKEPDRFHSCCFQCRKCPSNTFVNSSRDPYTCLPCAESEWSDEGSVRCETRSVDYLRFTEVASVIVLVSVVCVIIALVATLCLFTYASGTPVVRSAGGAMCALMLICLIVSSLGVFFFFGEPTPLHCVLRNATFTFFFAVFLSCMAVRSFQIVCIFKMAANFPNVHRLWVKHNGQWLFVGLTCVVHLVSCAIWITVNTPKPYRNTVSFKDRLILSCEMGNTVTLSVVMFISWFLGFLCLVFSYIGRDLPKSYNEAKSITFSLILFYLSWIAYFTAYLLVKSKNIQLLNAVAQISSIYGILFSYFIPKSYIIIFQPQRNTAAYFQSSIQNYTQTISRS